KAKTKPKSSANVRTSDGKDVKREESVVSESEKVRDGIEKMKIVDSKTSTITPTTIKNENDQGSRSGSVNDSEKKPTIDHTLPHLLNNVLNLLCPTSDPNSDKMREEYFRLVCMLIVSPTNEAFFRENAITGLKFDSYAEMWTWFVSTNKEGSTDKKKELETIEDSFNHLMELIRRKDCAQNTLADLKKKNLAVITREVDKVEHEKNRNRLNDDQTGVFEMVMGKIADLRNNPSAAATPLFVSGTAGTGKTFLINALADQLVIEKDSSAVILAASTGIAASHISGCTYHSLFSISYSTIINTKDKTKFLYKKLEPKRLKVLKKLYENTQLIIIDEVSMIGPRMLASINFRLQEIFKPGKLFGGKMVIFFGDLMQLPPVRQKRAFKELEKEFTDLQSLDAPKSLFKTFEYRELKINMRQEKDPEFGTAMLHARIQALTDEDHKTLRTRLICPEKGDKGVSMSDAVTHFIELMKKDPEIMAIFATHKQVDSFNKKVAARKQLEPVTIKKIAGKADGQLKLPEILELAINGRVMLLKNKDIRKKLFNGSIGSLISIRKNSVGFITSLEIQFGNKKTTSIDRMDENQFPVVMAYACTAHKCQGLTQKNVVISMKKFFGAGMGFVALSRVTTLEGLHLMNYYPSKIVCDIGSLRKCNELRASICLDLYPEPGIPYELRSKEARIDEFDGDDDDNERDEAVQAAIEEEENLVDEQMPEVEEKRMQIDVFKNRMKLPAAILEALIASNDEKDDDSVYTFENSGSDCFANAAVNILLSLTPLIQELKALPLEKYPVVDLLVKASQRGSHSKDVPQRLRRFLGSDNGQQDPAEFLKVIIKSLDIPRANGEYIRDDFRMAIKYEGVCEKGCMKTFDASFEVYALSVASSGDGIVRTIEDHVKVDLEANFVNCAAYHKSGCRKEVTSMTVIKKELKMPRYLILTPQMFAEDGDDGLTIRDILFDGISVNNTKIYEHKYKCTGAIQYESIDGKSGHCKSWRRAATEWSIANDNLLLTPKRALPNYSQGFRVMAFESLSKQ
ncbi:hypothetical protein PENTCL1PPCAC_13483, partial [Pristionchus entomophagus]